MALNFPNTPTLNQTYTNEGTTWTWNGVAWDLVESPLDYNNLINTPTIPSAQVQVNWNSVSGLSSILNKPVFASVATTGEYSDLLNVPPPYTYTLPTASTTVLGGVRVDGVTVQSINGVITAIASGIPTYNINGVPFNATQDITIAAEASTLTGTSLTPDIIISSLTSVGTLTDLTVAGDITAQQDIIVTGTVETDAVSANIVTAPTATLGAVTANTATISTVAALTVTIGTGTVTNDLTANANVVVATLPTAPTHATNKRYVDARSVAMSIALA